MKSIDGINGILDILKREYPDAVCALEYEKDYELLFATRLSAQCTDKRVNQVTPLLFKKYPTLQSLAEADIGQVGEVIHSCGFFRTKAKDIVMAADMLIKDFGGKVPGNMDDLLKLPGVGRKTAHLILGDIFKAPGSVVVDTHCIRVCGKLGLSEGTDPEKIETQLRRQLPPEETSDFCHRIVLHGRAVCVARKPKCDICALAALCDDFMGKDNKPA